MYKLLLIILLLFSCTKKEGPEDVLSNFVNYRFEDNQSKAYLLERSSGDLYERIDGMNEEDLGKFLNTNFEKKKFRIVLKQCEELKCFITYTLAYNTLKQSKPDFRVEVKKIAEVVFVDGRWKINEVNNVKAYYEGKEPIKAN